ncbi:MAG TPA: SDR family oxidoreductase [Casimicrobiaceae bacterium]|nr:SDR family oxidoreductase [Casimicrobiaceae bacterium]
MANSSTITPRIDFARELAGLYDLSGKVAFIPGGYGGIGEAIAWALALAGAKIVVAGRNRDKAEALASALRAANCEAQGIALDVHSVGEIRAATDAAADAYGCLDILVNCVGIQREEALADVTEDAYDEVYRVNLKAAMFLAQAAAKRQVAGRHGGRQVHLLSVRSHLGLRKRGYSAYCSTKGALVMLIKQHAMELAPEGITVNGVAPTFVYTELIRHVMENDAFRRQLLERIPLGRIADPKDVAGPAMFFCAPASGFVTGQVLYVDGGITASQ